MSHKRTNFTKKKQRYSLGTLVHAHLVVFQYGYSTTALDPITKLIGLTTLYRQRKEDLQIYAMEFVHQAFTMRRRRTMGAIINFFFITDS